MKPNGYERDPRNHTIFTCQFIVTTVITSVDLLGLHAENPPLSITVGVGECYML